MSDLRDKQPASREIDLTKDTFGCYRWEAVIDVWTYFGTKNKDVYARKVTLVFMSGSSRAAYGFAHSISHVLSLQQDIRETRISSLLIVWS